MLYPSFAAEQIVFYEDFTGNTGQERFTWGVYHRNAGWQINGHKLNSTGWGNAYHGGSWTADHDLMCGTPDTQRPLNSSLNDFNVEQLIFMCKDHMMTSMGDVDGYSVLWFSPNLSFNDVSEVNFNVNLTDLGTRQWIKVGVVSESRYQSLGSGGVYPENDAPGFVVSDVGASNLDSDLSGQDILVASWSGGASAGYPGQLKIGNNKISGGFNAGSDKMTRYPMVLKDNGNGTITFTANGSGGTANGSFPACPCRVVFYDHNYTPTKSESGYPRGFTWHWDNIKVIGDSDAVPSPSPSPTPPPPTPTPSPTPTPTPTPLPPSPSPTPTPPPPSPSPTPTPPPPSPPPADTTAPTVSITSPASGSTVGGNVTVSATASDNVAVTKVELRVNGVVSVTDLAAPYSFSWNTSSLSNGSYSLTARAYDAANNTTTSATINLVVNNSVALKPGDVNGDSKVDIFDLSILLANYSRTSATRATGDLNGDTRVDIFDLSILLGAMGS